MGFLSREFGFQGGYFIEVLCRHKVISPGVTVVHTRGVEIPLHAGEALVTAQQLFLYRP